MKNSILRFTFFIIFWIQSLNIYAQSIENRVDSINYLKKYIEQHKNNQELFQVLELDGGMPAITKTKKAWGIFNKTVSQCFGGTFAETDFIKDSILFSVRRWTRVYLNSQQDISTKSFEELIYDNDTLCYYFETKTLESKGKTDSIIYKVEFFLDNDEIIKKNIQGNFEQDAEIFVKNVLVYSREKIKNANAWIKSK